LERNASLIQKKQEFVSEECHMRSLAESAISTVKRRFSHTLYSKKRKAQANEIRLKVLTYNLSIISRLPTQFE